MDQEAQHRQEVHDQANKFLNEWFSEGRHDLGRKPTAGCDRKTLREALVNLILQSEANAHSLAVKSVRKGLEG